LDIDDIRTALRSLPEITEYQIRIAILKAQGCTNTEIAQGEEISEGTVRKHLKKIKQAVTKSGVKWSNYSR